MIEPILVKISAYNFTELVNSLKTFSIKITNMVEADQKLKTLGLILLIVITTIISLSATILAVYDDFNVTLSLQIIKPLLDTLLPVGAKIEHNSVKIINTIQQAIIVFGALIAASTLMWRTKDTLSRAISATSALLAVYGQLALSRNQVSLGVTCYCASAVSILIYYLLGTNTLNPPEGSKKSVTTWELSLFISIITIAVCLRFYGLNYLFNYFEGEETPFTIAGSDLKAMTLANMGDGGPWSPFGLLYFAIVYLPVKIFGTTILSMRLGAALPAIIILTLIYLMMRELFGRGAALTAAFFLSIDAKQISWARYEFPHGSTALTAVAIVWLTYRSFSSRNLIYPSLLAIFMGLSFHQYPSGQTAVAVPWIYLLYLIAFRRERSFSYYSTRLAFIGIGSLLWYYGWSFAHLLAYDTWSEPRLTGRFDTRVGWKANIGSDSELTLLGIMFTKLLNNAWELFGSMVYTLQISLPPQDHVPGFTGLTTRTIFILVPPFALFALFHFARNLKWRSMALLCAWVIAALAPCLLSDKGFPRRAATVFPALICIAGVGYWILRSNLSALWGKPWRIIAPMLEVPVATMLVLGSFNQWFSNTSMRFGEPGEVEVARIIRPMLQPQTLVFFNFADHYMAGRMTYLLLDDLDNPSVRPISWAVISEQSPLLPVAISNPRDVPQAVGKNLEYRWSKLRHHIPELQSSKVWRKLIFISERMPNTSFVDKLDRQVAEITAHCANHREKTLPSRAGFFHIFRIIECDLMTDDASLE
jgi:hypothetical protein